jgi:cytochrome c-type biogenesis protein CcmH
MPDITVRNTVLRRTPWPFVPLVVLFAGAGCSTSGSADATVPPPALTAAPSRALPAGHPPLEPVAADAVAGTVTVAPALRNAAGEGAALFLIARAEKDRQIVAVRKEDDRTFPHAFTLSSADAMTHGQPFAGPLEITARLSRSGDAAPGPGDLEGRVGGVVPGAQGVRVVLDAVRK